MRVKLRVRAQVTGSGSVATPFSPVASPPAVISCSLYKRYDLLGVLTFGVESVSAADIGDSFQTFFFSNLKSNFCLSVKLGMSSSNSFSFRQQNCSIDVI